MIYAVPLASVAGSNIDKKSETLSRMTGLEFLSFAREKGSTCKLVKGMTCVIPGSWAYCIINAGESTFIDGSTLGIKWPVLRSRTRLVESLGFMDEYETLHPGHEIVKVVHDYVKQIVDTSED